MACSISINKNRHCYKKLLKWGNEIMKRVSLPKMGGDEVMKRVSPIIHCTMVLLSAVELVGHTLLQ